jgi:hypothetical protein
MKYLKMLPLLGALVILLGIGLRPALDAQGPVKGPELPPKILAFQKAIEIAAGDSDLVKKLKERHNTAVRLLDERTKEYKKGIREISFVFEATRLVAEAKLDLADRPDARVTALEQTLEVAQFIEKHLQDQLDKGFGSRADLERARFGRLTVEVELLKAKQK